MYLTLPNCTLDLVCFILCVFYLHLKEFKRAFTITSVHSHITQTCLHTHTFSPLISFILIVRLRVVPSENRNVHTKLIQIRSRKKGQTYPALDDRRTKVKTLPFLHRLFCLKTLDPNSPAEAGFSFPVMDCLRPVFCCNQSSTQ